MNFVSFQHKSPVFCYFSDLLNWSQVKYSVSGKLIRIALNLNPKGPESACGRPSPLQGLTGNNTRLNHRKSGSIHRQVGVRVSLICTPCSVRMSWSPSQTSVCVLLLFSQRETGVRFITPTEENVRTNPLVLIINLNTHRRNSSSLPRLQLTEQPFLWRPLWRTPFAQRAK